MSKDVLESMILSEGLDFYSALQSVDNLSEWIFVERDMKSNSYNLFFFNQVTKSKNLIFSQDNSPDSNYAFIPFAWSKDIVYMEAKVFGSATENEGIWSYNITTKQFSKLPISSSYISTPIISPDGTKFIYGGTKDTNKGLNSPMNILFVYDLNTNQEKMIVKDNNSWFSIIGWIKDDIQATDLIDIDANESNLETNRIKSEILQPSFKLPWSSSVTYCVSTGPYGVPSGVVGSTIKCASWTSDHAANKWGIDFDVPNNVYDAVRAAAAGTVYFAGISGSLTTDYGRLVKIKHSDGTYTYYGHLNSIAVKVNDIVQQGCVIGDGGTTGGSTGDHIHFEWYDVGDARFSSATYPIFSECGCTPRRNYQYTSNNSDGNCGNTAPENDNCADAILLPDKTTCSYTSGTVDFATDDGFPDIPSCALPSPTQYGVFYKFVAATTSATITVDPYVTTDIGLDAVVVLYSGSNVYNLVEFNNKNACADPTGKVKVTLQVSGLTKGQTYWIRVYDWGTGKPAIGSGGFNICVSHTATAVEVISASDKIKIYPNPTTGKFEISEIDALGDKCKIEIFNHIGAQIYVSENENIGNKISLDLSAYPVGMYMVKLSNNGMSYQKKLIKN